MLLTLTWCCRTPADTPTRVSIISAISTEHQLDDVACACYVGRKGGAAALLHQGCTVPVRDCQVVVASGSPWKFGNVKCSELQRKDQSLLHLDCLCLQQPVWIVVRVAWWGDFTCGKEYELNKRKIFNDFLLPLTFAATAVCRLCRARRWWHLPESSTSGWAVRDTWDCEALSTIAAAVVLRFIVAVQFSRESAGLARSGRDWERAERTWIVNYIWTFSRRLWTNHAYIPMNFQWSFGVKINEKWNRKEGRLVSRKYEIVN